MCNIPGSINIPLESLKGEMCTLEKLSSGELPIYCLCRRGVFSVEATKEIFDAISSGKYPDIHSVYNIQGGLQQWADIDNHFPYY